MAQNWHLLSATSSLLIVNCIGEGKGKQQQDKTSYVHHRHRTACGVTHTVTLLARPAPLQPTQLARACVSAMLNLT
jgi:hypothetical protein